MNIITPIKKTCAIVLAMFASSALWSVEISTNPVGCYTVDCPANSDTHISIPVTRAPVFEGKVASVSGKTIVFEGESAFTANEFVYSKGVQPNHYYAIFKNGIYEGAWFDIVSNSASSITIECPDDALTSDLVASSVQIIPHWTFNTLMPNGAGTNVGKNGVFYTLVLLFDPTFVGTNIIPSGYFFSDFGDSPYTHWAKVGEFEEDGDYVNANDVVIPPNSYFTIRNPRNKPATTLTFSGNVKMFKSELAVGILADSKNQDNILPNPSALPIKFSDLTDSLVEGGLIQKSIAPIDTLMIYDNSKPKTNKYKLGYYYYYAGEGNAYNAWYEIGSSNPVNDIEIPATSVFFIRKAAKSKPAFINTTTFTPQYLK